MYIQTEETPNPNAIKFLPGETVNKGSAVYVAKKEDAHKSPLAKVLFEITGVEAVFLGEDFITVTKADNLRWEILKPMVLTEIMDFYISGQVAVGKQEPANFNQQGYDENDPVIKQIMELLDTRVRPAVAQDGGDIVFKGFTEGTVYVELHGSCSGCPSSTATLKDGIENMLKHYIPEVKAVEAAA
jgi:Fe-S cluster biogenesis protein NfuA